MRLGNKNLRWFLMMILSTLLFGALVGAESDCDFSFGGDDDDDSIEDVWDDIEEEF